MNRHNNEQSPASAARSAVRSAAEYTDSAISRALLRIGDAPPTGSGDGEYPDLSTLKIEFENDQGEWEYDENSYYGKIVYGDDGAKSTIVKIKVSSDEDLTDIKLQVNLID